MCAVLLPPGVTRLHLNNDNKFGVGFCVSGADFVASVAAGPARSHPTPYALHCAPPHEVSCPLCRAAHIGIRPTAAMLSGAGRSRARGTDIDIFGATYTFDVIMSCCDVSTDARPPAANRLLLERSACVKQSEAHRINTPVKWEFFG
jgi:hypothetical protein